jgi:quercetin dioxygenase-like cupin family protein
MTTHSIGPIHGALIAGLAALTLIIVTVRQFPVAQAPDHVHQMASGGGTAVSPSGVVVKTLSCEKLADIPGKSITTTLVTFPPGASSPAHRHPGSVTVFMLKGTMRSRLSGEPVETYRIGETWFEPNGALHALAENPSKTDAAEFLAIFVTDENCGPLTIYEDKAS